MKLLLTLFLICVIPVFAEAPAVKDAELTKQIQGTWVTARGTATYHADGTGAEVIRLGKGADMKIVRLTTRWSVRDGKLCLDCATSSNPEIVPIGQHLKDIIVSISNDRLILEAFEGYGSAKGTRATCVRQPAPKQGEQAVPSDGQKPPSSESSTDPTAPADAH